MPEIKRKIMTVVVFVVTGQHYCAVFLSQGLINLFHCPFSSREKSMPPTLPATQHQSPSHKTHHMTVDNGMIARHQQPHAPVVAVNHHHERPLATTVIGVGHQVDESCVIDGNSNVRSTLNQNKYEGDSQMNDNVRRVRDSQPTLAPPRECNGSDSANNNIHYSSSSSHVVPSKQHRNSVPSSLVSTSRAAGRQPDAHPSTAASKTSGDVTLTGSQENHRPNRRRTDRKSFDSGLCQCDRRATVGAVADGTASAATRFARVVVGGGVQPKSVSSSATSVGRRLNAIVRDRIIFFSQKDALPGSGSGSLKTVGGEAVHAGHGGVKKSAKS